MRATVVGPLPSLAWAILTLILSEGASSVFAQELVRIRDVVYGRKFGMALTMDVWKPGKQNGRGVIFMVSGAFQSGIDMVDSGFFGPVIFKPFLDRGHALFLVSHGAQPKFTVSEIVPDIHRAVRFIRVHAREHDVDPDRLGIMGTSSGGFLALTIGTAGKPGDPAAKDPVDQASSRVQAVACFCPPPDLVNYGKQRRSIVEYEPVQFVWHAFGLQGKPKEEQLKVLRELSPINAIARDTPPTLIIHGEADQKVPHQLITRKNTGHGWPDMAKDHALLADWFDKHLPSTGEERK